MGAEMQAWDELPVDQVIHGDCLLVMRGMPDCSVDACVVDPPYGFGEVKDIAGLLQAWMQDEDDSRYLGKSGFMGKEWDSGVPGPRYWREVYRVLKPGAHMLAFSSTRTYDLLVIALRLANFQIRDTIIWCHGQGFPKSLNLGNGRGTALKPAVEPICLARKPISESTIASNVLRWNGCGALNIDQCRVGTAEDMNPNDFDDSKRTAPKFSGILNGGKEGQYRSSPGTVPNGRFPSHLLMSHDPRCIARGTKRVRGNGGGWNGLGNTPRNAYSNQGWYPDGINRQNTEGQEEVPAFECHPSCPVRVLGEQSGESKSAYPNRPETAAKNAVKTHQREGTVYSPHKDEAYGWQYTDTGTAARYFTQFHDPLDTLDAPFHYFSKSSRRDRNNGLEGMPTSASSRYGKMNGTPEHGPKYDTPEQNTHPCVKSTALMRWLCRLITPPGGIVLDPFCGSGSTCCAAVYEGMHFIGIEQSNTPDAPYVNIARARIAHAQQEARREESEGQEWECVEECPIKVLDAQSGIRQKGVWPVKDGPIGYHGNGKGHTRSERIESAMGGASRYFQQFPPEPVSLWDEEVAE